MRITAIVIVILAGIYSTSMELAAQTEAAGTYDLIRLARLLLSLTILGYFAVSPFLAARQVASKLWSAPQIRLPIHGRVSSQGIAYTFSTSETETRWEEFAKVRRADDLLVLQTADGVLSILPRSFFQSEADWKTLQQWVELRVQEAK